jgi:hypothetical protein
LYHDADYTADFAGLGQTLARPIHRSCSHLLQIIVTHYPGNDAADEAADDAKYPENQDGSAAMRRKRLLGDRLGFYFLCGRLSPFYHNSFS